VYQRHRASGLRAPRAYRRHCTIARALVADGRAIRNPFAPFGFLAPSRMARLPFAAEAEAVRGLVRTGPAPCTARRADVRGRARGRGGGIGRRARDQRAWRPSKQASATRAAMGRGWHSAYRALRHAVSDDGAPELDAPRPATRAVTRERVAGAVGRAADLFRRAASRSMTPGMRERLGVVPFWKSYDRRQVLRTAALAEDLGYESIWIPEAWAYEQFQLLTEIALATKTLKLATGIANVFSRSAGLLAMSAATLDEISGGRAILGLGTSGRTVVENFHGVPYRKPLTRLKETIAICRTLWRGGRMAPELSTLFDARHFKLEMTPLRPDIPVYVASLQEAAIRAVGALADGWVPTFWPYRHLGDGIALLAEGARAAGRDPAQLDVAPFVAVVPFPDVAAARALVKPLVAFYIGGMGTYYHALFCRYGFEENANLVRDLYEKDRRQAAGAVSDELVDAIAICGPPGLCRERLGEWRAHGVGAALLTLPVGMPFEVTEQLLRDVAPAR
jgi:F420-dependent oxidoreductase-like protein